MIRVAACQMAPAVADVDANLARAERLVRDAVSRGARIVVLPEFFTSAMAFHPAMAAAVAALSGRPMQWLRQLARQTGASIGGSFLAWHDDDAYNTFVLARPDGSTCCHDKDHPTFVENCYYRGGHDDGVLETADGRIGAALCWELLRTQTARRLSGRVEMVIGGSCWWQRDGTDGERSRDMLRDAPRTLARLLGVPVAHASHVGPFQGGSAGKRDYSPRPFHFLGETQIVDGRGEVLARMPDGAGEGVVTADLILGSSQAPRDDIPDRFWIPEMPAGWDEAWRTALERDGEYYRAQTRPALQARFIPPAGRVDQERR